MLIIFHGFHFCRHQGSRVYIFGDQCLMTRGFFWTRPSKTTSLTTRQTSPKNMIYLSIRPLFASINSILRRITNFSFFKDYPDFFLIFLRLSLQDLFELKYSRNPWSSTSLDESVLASIQQLVPMFNSNKCLRVRDGFGCSLITLAPILWMLGQHGGIYPNVSSIFH